MKHAFCREVRFAGHRRAGLAAASRRLTVGRPFKAGALVPPSGSRAASAALESHPVEACHIIRRSATGYWGWVAETCLERPAYPQMPLRGKEKSQTPEVKAPH